MESRLNGTTEESPVALVVEVEFGRIAAQSGCTGIRFAQKDKKRLFSGIPSYTGHCEV